MQVAELEFGTGVDHSCVILPIKDSSLVAELDCRHEVYQSWVPDLVVSEWRWLSHYAPSTFVSLEESPDIDCIWPKPRSSYAI